MITNFTVLPFQYGRNISQREILKLSQKLPNFINVFFELIYSIICSLLTTTARIIIMVLNLKVLTTQIFIQL